MTYENDVAVMKLSEPIVFGEYIKDIKRASSSPVIRKFLVLKIKYIC